MKPAKCFFEGHSSCIVFDRHKNPLGRFPIVQNDRLMITNQTQSVESMLPIALFVNLGLFVRAEIKGAKEFGQSIRQVKMIWARQRTLNGMDSAQSDHLKQIDDLLDFTARLKVAKLIQRGVINREDVVFEGNDRNPGASAPAAAHATAPNPPPFKSEAAQTAEAIAAVERKILKELQESEYQAALAADQKREEAERQVKEAAARALEEEQRAEEEAEVLCM